MFEYVDIPEAKHTGTRILTTAFRVAMTAPNPHAAVTTLIEILGKTFNAKRSYLYELPPDGSEFECSCEWCAAGVEPMSDVTHGLTMDMASRWFGDGEDRSLLVIRDVSKVAEVSPEYAALFAQRSMKCQVLGKLIRGNRPMGTLGFDDPDPGMIDDLCELMYPICAFTTSTVNTRNLLGRMSSVGMVDKLTGAGTRMSFYQKAEHLPAAMPIGMAYLDIAGLQGINDLRGHDAGDEVLIAVRQILISEFQDDQVFRMSGDEFLVAAYGMPEDPFRSAIKRIRSRLDDLAVFVAMGIGWQSHLGSDYDSLVRHVWLECVNAKHEWERRGGQRLGASLDDVENSWVSKDAASDVVMGHLDLPCYRSEEFYRRANVWTNHVETKRIVVIAFDINYFKLYNDIYGRAAGDLLLQMCAKTISKTAAQLHGVAGYLGGDNFVAVLPVSDDAGEQYVSERIQEVLDNLDVAEGFAPSVGVVITSDLEAGVSILYDRALVALQEVKGDYTRHIAFYDEGRFERERENQLLLIEAREGLERGEFTFFLQPKVDIKSGRVVSAEALVRWIRDGEVVPPYKFVGLMETSGHIFTLDRYVWDAVCEW